MASTQGDECQGMSVADALRWATRALVAGGSATPRLDAEVLLGHLLALGRAQLYVHWDDPLDALSARRYTGLIRRRVAHEPVAYLVGARAFYDLNLMVDEHVLIPRPETEHMVEAALAWAQERHVSWQPLRVVDVGTGSGALAIVMARHLVSAEVWATDVSPGALRVTAGNLRCYHLSERVTLLCGDLLAPLAGPFDLILANLPYVARKEIETLAPDVTDYEPRLALDGGEDGLDLIRRLLLQVPPRLARPGLLLLEIDHRQAEAVLVLVRQHLPDAVATLLADYAGLERVVRVERFA